MPGNQTAPAAPEKLISAKTPDELKEDLKDPAKVEKIKKEILETPAEQLKKLDPSISKVLMENKDISATLKSASNAPAAGLVEKKEIKEVQDYQKEFYELHVGTHDNENIKKMNAKTTVIKVIGSVDSTHFTSAFEKHKHKVAFAKDVLANMDVLSADTKTQWAEVLKKGGILEDFAKLDFSKSADVTAFEKKYSAAEIKEAKGLLNFLLAWERAANACKKITDYKKEGLKDGCVSLELGGKIQDPTTRFSTINGAGGGVEPPPIKDEPPIDVTVTSPPVPITGQGVNTPTGSVSLSNTPTGTPKGNDKIQEDKPETPEGNDKIPGNKPEAPEGNDKIPGNKPESPEGNDKIPGNKPEAPEGNDKIPGNKPEAPEGNDKIQNKTAPVAAVGLIPKGAGNEKNRTGEANNPEKGREVVKKEEEIPKTIAWNKGRLKENTDGFQKEIINKNYDLEGWRITGREDFNSLNFIVGSLMDACEQEEVDPKVIFPGYHLDKIRIADDDGKLIRPFKKEGGDIVVGRKKGEDILLGEDPVYDEIFSKKVQLWIKKEKYAYQLFYNHDNGLPLPEAPLSEKGPRPLKAYDENKVKEYRQAIYNHIVEYGYDVHGIWGKQDSNVKKLARFVVYACKYAQVSPESLFIGNRIRDFEFKEYQGGKWNSIRPFRNGGDVIIAKKGDKEVVFGENEEEDDKFCEKLKLWAKTQKYWLENI